MKKIVTVLGARPQFVKASVVSHALRDSGRIREVLVHTGQHFDANMSDVFFRELGMPPPAHQLGIHGGAPRRDDRRGCWPSVERVLLSEQPDAVLVYGDTNSTLAGALAAVKLHIPVAHVEAGLRSFNLAMPEEVNRVLTDRISRWLFMPDGRGARAPARAKACAEACIVPVGDVMYDVALHHGAARGRAARVLGRLGLAPGATCSRRCTARRTPTTRSDWPRSSRRCEALSLRSCPWCGRCIRAPAACCAQAGGCERLPTGLHLVDPVGYLDMVQLEQHAARRRHRLRRRAEGGVLPSACRASRCATRPSGSSLVEAGWNRLAPPPLAAEVGAALCGRAGHAGARRAPLRRRRRGTAHRAAPARRTWAREHPAHQPLRRLAAPRHGVPALLPGARVGARWATACRSSRRACRMCAARQPRRPALDETHRRHRLPLAAHAALRRQRPRPRAQHLGLPAAAVARRAAAGASEFRPDVVIASSTYPMDIWVARRIARLAGARLVLRGARPVAGRRRSSCRACRRWHPFILLCQKAEDDACRDADVVVSMLPKVAEHMAAHGLDLRKLHIVPNGIAPDEWQARRAPLAAGASPRTSRSSAPPAAGGRSMPARTACRTRWTCCSTRPRLLRDEPFAFVLVGDGHEKARLVAARRATKALTQRDAVRADPEGADPGAAGRDSTSPTSAGSASRCTASASRRTS